MSSGLIAVGSDGFTVTNSQASSASDLLIESGPVTDQTFAGGAAPTNTPAVYIGAGDYSTEYPAGNPELTLTPDFVTGELSLSSAGLGVMTFTTDVPPVPDTGYF